MKERKFKIKYVFMAIFLTGLVIGLTLGLIIQIETSENVKKEYLVDDSDLALWDIGPEVIFNPVTSTINSKDYKYEYISIPKSPVIVKTSIGTCYTDFSVDGLRGAFDFCSNAEWSRIKLPKKQMLIDASQLNGTIFKVDVSNLIFHASEAKFVVIGDCVLFDFETYNSTFIEINVLRVSENKTRDVLICFRGDYNNILMGDMDLYSYQDYFVKRANDLFKNLTIG